MPRTRRYPRRSVDAPIYRLELDVILHFNPPMDENSRGIRLTRAIDLPFVPSEKIAVYSRTFDNCPDPMGFCLKEITWDVDRQVFLADTYYSYIDEPLAIIPDDLAEWLERGWQFGSYADKYKVPSTETEEDDESNADDIDAVEDEETWQTLRPNRRPKEFNRTFKSLIRMMAELNNNCSIAYAMAKSQQYFDEQELQKDKSPTAKKFADAIDEFRKLTDEQQWNWREKVQRRYPRLQRLVLKSRLGQPGNDLDKER